MKDLGWTPPKSDTENSGSVVPSVEPGPQYPSLRFNGEQAAKGGLGDCEYGEEYTITLRVKATSIGGSMYPGSGNEKDKPAMEFDVLACDPPKEAEDESEEEEYSKPRNKIEMGPKDGGMKL